MGNVKASEIERAENGEMHDAEPNSSEMPESWTSFYLRAGMLAKTLVIHPPDAINQLLALVRLQHQTIEELKERVNTLEQKKCVTTGSSASFTLNGMPVSIEPVQVLGRFDPQEIKNVSSE